MKKTSDFKVGDVVIFGRAYGEQTLGKVIKVNRKTLKVETLETRGRGRGKEPGRVWGVPPSLCTLANGNKQPQDHPDGTCRTPEQQDIQAALDKLTSQEIALLRNYFQKQL